MPSKTSRILLLPTTMLLLQENCLHTLTGAICCCSGGVRVHHFRVVHRDGGCPPAHEVPGHPNPKEAENLLLQSHLVPSPIE